MANDYYRRKINHTAQTYQTDYDLLLKNKRELFKPINKSWRHYASIVAQGK
jgi:hypothetical protein